MFLRKVSTLHRGKMFTSTYNIAMNVSLVFKTILKDNQK